MTKQNNQPKMRDNYCPQLNPSHRETLLSLHLKYELLWIALKVTGTGHPFLRNREKGQSISWQTIPYTTEYTKAALMKEMNRLISIGVIKK